LALASRKPSGRPGWPPPKKPSITPAWGQNGNLSGFLLFAKINCTLAQFGQDQSVSPPAQPQFPDLAPQNLVIANTAGVITLKLHLPGRPRPEHLIRGSAPVSQGRETCNDFRILGTCPTPAAGSADITSLLHGPLWRAARGQEVYVGSTSFVDGWESCP